MGETINVLFYLCEDGTYGIHVKESWSGRRVSGRFVPPYVDRQLKTLERRLSHLDSRSHELREVGYRLFSALCGFDTTSPMWSEPTDLSVQKVFNTIIRHALKQHETVALVLGFGRGCDELVHYPWELLHDGDHFLLALGVFTLSRVLQWPDSSGNSEFPVHSPFRILSIVPSHTNGLSLESEHSFEVVQQALAPLISGGQIMLDQLEPPTFGQLAHYLDLHNGAERLNSDELAMPCYAIHFSGQGAYGRLCPQEDCKVVNKARARKCLACGASLNRVNPQICLCFSNDEGLNSFIDMQSLQGLLLRSHVRLVVFTIYEATTETREPVGLSLYSANHIAIDAALTNALAAFQVSAVVGMFFSLRDDRGPKFLFHFYEALADGSTLEEAFSGARQALLSVQSNKWFIPVLCRHVTESQASPVPLMIGDNSDKGYSHFLACLGPSVTFVGRKQELQDLDELLTIVTSDHQKACLPDRLRSSSQKVHHIALTGASGIGKSTLAREVVQRNQDKFPGGIIGVSLQSGKSFADALAEVIRLLHLQLPDGLTVDISRQAYLVQSAVRALASRRLTCLLLLDGFEEVEDQGELEMWQEFLCTLPQEVVVIVTSHVNPGIRMALNCDWYEHCLGKMTDTDLLTLFAVLVEESGLDQYIRLHDPRQQRILREICRLLDGYPLGAKLVFGTAHSVDSEVYSLGGNLRFWEELRDKLCSMPLAGMMTPLQTSYGCLTPLARLLLAYLSMFILPFNREQSTMLMASVPVTTIQKMMQAESLQGAISAAEQEINSETLLESWCEARDELVQASFMQFDGLAYTIHSQVRHFALARLPLEEQPCVHRLIAAYYRSLPQPRVEELLAAFEHLEAARKLQDLVEGAQVAVGAVREPEGQNQNSTVAISLVQPPAAQQNKVAEAKHNLSNPTDNHFVTEDFGKIETETDEVQRRAAWSLYVELTTRVATQPLESGQGTLREAVDSLYTLFARIREALHSFGPKVAIEGEKSFNHVALCLLNKKIRPFCTKWHQLLLVYEKRCPEGTTQYEYESQWEQAEEMRAELAELQKDLQMYVEALANMAGIKHVTMNHSLQEVNL